MLTIEQFIRIFRAKISFGKKKRLEAIQEYFATEHNYQFEFNGNSDNALENTIEFVTDNPELEQIVFTDIVDLLHDRYSLGDSFIIYNLNTYQELTYVQFADSITDLFENIIQIDMFDYDPLDINNDPVGQVIKVKCRYREYQKDLGNNTRSENINHSGQIPIYFDYRSRKVLVNTGYNKAAATLVKAINDSIIGFSVHEIRVKDNVARIPNLIGTDLEPISLLSLYLILHEFGRNNFIVNDILSISFNNEQAPRVKMARLGGTNLLQDSDVVHRVYRGDKITNFVLDIIQISEQGQSNLVSEVLFDFRTNLKISFMGLSHIGNTTLKDICLQIEQIIYNAIINEQTVEETQGIINTNLPRIDAGNGELYSRVMLSIKQQLCEIIGSEQDKLEVERFFNRTYGL